MRTVVLALSLSLASLPASAQGNNRTGAAAHPEVGLGAVALLHVAGSALIGSFLAASRGDDVWKGAWDGGVGGLLHFSGQAVASRVLPEAPFLGRAMANVGAARVASAGSFESAYCITIPYLFFRFNSAACPDRPIVTVDIGVMVATTVAALGPGDVHVRSSLAGGVPTFVVPFERRGSASHNATTLGGVVVFREPSTGIGISRKFYDPVWNERWSHELAHVTQIDFAFAVGSEPVDRWLRSRASPGIGRVLRYTNTGLYIIPAAAVALVPPMARFLEQEALNLTLLVDPLGIN